MITWRKREIQSGYRVELLLTVEVDVLARVDDVEPCGPEEHGQAEDRRQQRELIPDGDPRSERRESQRETEHEMRHLCEAFRE